MQKTFSLLVRNVPKDVKNSLKRMARSGKVKVSVNHKILEVLHDVTASDIEQFELNKIVKK